MKTAGSKRIVFATMGSLGDLHPCLTLGRELKRRGHRITIACTPFYQARVEAAGLGFERMRPAWDASDAALIRQCEDLKKGPEILYRKIVLPQLRDTYDDLLSIARTADGMIAGELVYAAPLVAEKLGVRWISLILSPFSFFSADDPSVTVNVPSLIRLRKFGAGAYRLGLNIGRLATRHWSNPVRRLRREERLRPHCDPIFRDKFSRDLVLALFSSCLAPKQRDWPLQTVQTGFVYSDGVAPTVGETRELSAFLSSGDPPLVFTQGSTAVHNPGDFYRVSAAAARRLKKRALLIGVDSVPGERSADVWAVPYAAYSEIFPRASVVVHQGGSGTTGEAMRSGRPMLIVPYGWDQPDNAARVERLGTGLQLARTQYTVKAASSLLDKLLNDARFAQQAAGIQNQMAAEDGLATAANAIESVL